MQDNDEFSNSPTDYNIQRLVRCKYESSGETIHKGLIISNICTGTNYKWI